MAEQLDSDYASSKIGQRTKPEMRTFLPKAEPQVKSSQLECQVLGRTLSDHPGSGHAPYHYCILLPSWYFLLPAIIPCHCFHVFEMQIPQRWDFSLIPKSGWV